MEQVLVHLDERLSSVGDTYALAGHLDEKSYSLGDHDFSLPQGIDYDLAITNVGEGILATGILKAHVEGVCDRCLEKAEFDVSGEVDGYYLFQEPEIYEDSDEDEVDYYLVDAQDNIDLTDALTAALLFETPFVVLCKPDCLGLCPTCGANLNEGDCGCAARAAEERASSPDNPFSVLSQLDLDE